MAADEGWSSAEVFSRAFRRTYGLPPSQAAEVRFRVPAPNGLHFHPPQSLWLDGAVAGAAHPPDATVLMIAHSAHRRELARAMLAGHDVDTRRGDPLDWMRGN